ncbi:hypothetical protein J8273_3480 [Carpediemonas membranifera]|uniref:Uncharacterized protein n=1 Tax=Carpediemonas membranifera TaxID=201153 RepID=A0A8J6AWI2_9EUKA|nr:hypothetical protein J8273_3480 [Carpediemonas membranifera]|eukprot:KAG9393345.1 hypothetical protein J8273_3480 [Carpediemonas membranifera]
MNVELADGEELPVALHTLNQGAVWACLVGGGANPDLEGRMLKKAREEQPGKTNMHDKIRKALTPEAKCLWFLCRKFFFALNVAEKDGESYQWNWHDICHHHRMYMGRLFMLSTANHTALTRARMPRALEVESNVITHIARTPKGMWRWGYSGNGQLGFKSSEFVDPTRLTFPACPKVAELEASLPPWEKHTMVTDVSMKGWQTFIVTPVGTVMAGDETRWYTDLVQEYDNRFHPVAVPAGFIPDHIVHEYDIVILSMCNRYVISGNNCHGQLGLGHENDMAGFEELPFRVDRIMPSQSFHVFLSSRQLLFAGQVLSHIVQSGLLPGYREGDRCLTATPLRFLARVKGFFCDQLTLVWVNEGSTHLCDYDKQCSVPFKATALGRRMSGGQCVHSFRDPTDQWFKVGRVSDGVAELVACVPPSSREEREITPVDVDPWTPAETGI